MRRGSAWLWLGLVVACTTEDDGATGSTSGASAVAPDTTGVADTEPDEGSSSTTLPPLPDPSGGGGGPAQTVACRQYLECAEALGQPDVDGLDGMFGPEGTCWDDGADEASACNQTCRVELLDLVEGVEAMGGTVPDACMSSEDVPFFVIENMLSDHCVQGCHEPGGDFAGLFLGEDPHGEIVGAFSTQADLFLVDPGDHEASYLWHKVAGSHGSVGGSGSRMPRGAPALSDGQIADLAAWIDAGAPP